MNNGSCWLRSRRWFLASLSSVPLMTSLTDAQAQSSSDVNRIIKDLAPIAGQQPSGGYPPTGERLSPPLSPSERRSVIIGNETIYIDVRRRIEIEVYFDYNSDRITHQAHSQLSALGRALSSAELLSFPYLIAGHTDAVGSDAYNLDLSARRARAVSAYLSEAYPIDPHRLRTVGFGFHNLKRPDAPRAAINRRVEITAIVP
jgi:outer membrane protein OmpA-like peptidoglycan-associated protein